MLHDNLDINGYGHLTIGGYDTVELAKEFGTPLYVLHTDRVYENCVMYKKLMEKYFGEGSMPLFASKALSCLEIYRIANKAGIGIDVVSPGEIFTAVKAGFPMDKAYFHGNNKTDADIEFALDNGVGCFVVDNYEELNALDAAVAARGKKQKIMLRIAPGISTKTHKAVSTGAVDSKFGVPIATGQALEFVKSAFGKPSLELVGLHCHIGSTIFDYQPFAETANVMVSFMKDIKSAIGITLPYLNLGGGFGVQYVDTDPSFDYEKVMSDIHDSLKASCDQYGLPCPKLIFEPGRSVVATAGITLYTVGSYKTIDGYKSYVSVDGGMADNPRYALYQSKYTCLIANKADQEKTVTATVAGRCCESGDLIQENVALQQCERGDIMAVLVTGAYNYAMSSNYNRLPRPAMVGIGKDGKKIIVKRESFEDLIKNDI